MERVALFLCDCANEIKKKVDTIFLKEFFRGKVDFVSHHKHLCDQPSQKRMEYLLKEEDIKRVVIGGCSPQLHLETFQRVLSWVGLSPYLMELIPLREQCSYVHEREATEKARVLLELAIERVKLYQDIDEKITEIRQAALVIGGGVAGVNAALELSKKGIYTYLVEERPWIGGVTSQVGMAFPTGDCAYCVGVKSDIRGVRKCFYRADLPFYPNLSIITNAEIKEVRGAVGDFFVKVVKRPTFVKEDCISCGECERVCPIVVEDRFNKGFGKRKAIYKEFEAIPNTYVVDRGECVFCGECKRVCPEKAVDFSQREEVKQLNVGAIIVATGIKEFDPSKIPQYKYKEYREVITQLELARLLDPAGPTGGKVIIDGREPQCIVMVQCVGSRDERYNTYCSRLCCMMAIKHAIMIKERNPKSTVYICYIDIRTTGVEGYEEWYEKAREKGVRFIPGRPTEVKREGESLVVHTEDISIGEKVELKADLVVLSAGIEVSEGTKKIASIIDIRLNKDGFIEVIDPKVRFLETRKWGIFTCGGARGATDIPESILQANAAASKVSTLLLQEKIVTRRRYPKVDEERCKGCGVCEEVCPFRAIEVKENKANVNRDLCRGCGVCGTNCPLFALSLLGFDKELSFTIEGLANRGVILAFTCFECGYAAMDLAAFEGRKYDERLYIVQVPCLGRVSALDIIRTINKGAKGVVLIGCMDGRCHYGNDKNVEREYALAHAALCSAGKMGKLLKIGTCGASVHSLMGALSLFCEGI